MTFPHPPDQLHHASYDTLMEICKPGSVAAVVPNVIGATKMTWKSWGEELVLQVSRHGHGSAVHITSKSALPTQIIDYGLHRKNVERVLDGLQRRLGAGRLLTEIA